LAVIISLLLQTIKKGIFCLFTVLSTKRSNKYLFYLVRAPINKKEFILRIVCQVRLKFDCVNDKDDSAGNWQKCCELRPQALMTRKIYNMNRLGSVVLNNWHELFSTILTNAHVRFGQHVRQMSAHFPSARQQCRILSHLSAIVTVSPLV